MNPLLEALSLAGDAFDRPGAAVRGLLAGRPDQLAYLIPGAESLGLVDRDRRVTGADLLRQAGLVNGDEDSLGATLGGMAVDVATNPLSYLPFIGGLFGSGKGGLSAMKGARGNFPMAYGAEGGAARVVGGSPFQKMQSRNLLSQLNAENAAAAGADTLTGGMYDAARQVGAVVPEAHPLVGRHEIVHGMVNQAARTGQTEGLPFLVRMAARAQPADPAATGFRAGMGGLLDELAAHTLQERGTLNQLGGAGRFLFGGAGGPVRESYAQAFDAASPLVGALYRSMGYAPHAAAAAGAGGLGLGLSSVM